MATPILKLFMAKPSAAWLALPKEEQDHLMALDVQSTKDVGATEIIICNSLWSNERWLLFGIHQYPDEKALQAHADHQVEVGWYNLAQAETYLGVTSTPIEPVTEKNGVYKLFLAQPTQAGYQLDEAAQQKIFTELEEKRKEVGNKLIFTADVITSERYGFFGIEYYPSLEAVIAFRKCLNEMGWFQYMEADVLLGTLFSED